jgi:SAM-dependent methyltransferase
MTLTALTWNLKACLHNARRAAVRTFFTTGQQLEKMQRDWDDRARRNALHFIATERQEWVAEDFFGSGEDAVAGEILTDMTNICQGKTPDRMRVLEIGCGAGRITRALARMFGEVHAVDVSSEMVRLAREALAPFPNAHVYQNNGRDLAVLPPLEFDFAFSALVFQHIPSPRIIESYIREVSRVLRPGALFKFQVQGDPKCKPFANDTWEGAPITEELALKFARKCGFDLRYREGAGTQYFWLWFFKE